MNKQINEIGDKIYNAKWDLLERVAKGELFLDAVADVVEAHKLTDDEKQACINFVLAK